MSVIYRLNEVQEVRRSRYSQAVKKSLLENEPAQASRQTVAAPVANTQDWMLRGFFALLVMLAASVIVLFGLPKRNSFSETTLTIESLKTETKFKPFLFISNSPAKPAPQAPQPVVKEAVPTKWFGF